MPTSTADMAILGLVLTHGGVDLGELTDFGFNPNVTTYAFKSVRSGKSLTVRETTTEVNLEITFTTQNILDPAVIALFVGGAGGAMLFEATEGALVVTRPNAETGGKQIVFNIPNASLRGSSVGGTPGTEASTYSFTATALSVDGAAVGTLTAATPA